MKIGKLFGFTEPEARPAPISPKVDRGIARAATSTTSSVPTLYSAVSILHGSKCCQQVQATGQKRFLARAAPHLPLPECTMPEQCTCRFKKHPDRRENDERRGSTASTSGIWYAGPERRQGQSAPRGRRSTDR